MYYLSPSQGFDMNNCYGKSFALKQICINKTAEHIICFISTFICDWTFADGSYLVIYLDDVMSYMWYWSNM